MAAGERSFAITASRAGSRLHSIRECLNHRRRSAPLNEFFSTNDFDLNSAPNFVRPDEIQHPRCYQRHRTRVTVLASL